MSETDYHGYLLTQGSNWRKVGDELTGTCPACNATHERSLSVNLTTGQWVCNRKNNCGQSGSFRQLRRLYGDDMPTKPRFHNEQTATYVVPKHNAKALKDDGREFLHGRGLDDLTIGAWRVGQEATYFRKINAEGDGLVWPVYAPDGKLANVKSRCLLTKDFANKAGTAKWPIGIHLVDTAINGGTLILVEGELDAMSGWQYGLKNVVSLPNGAGDQNWIDLAWDWLQVFTRIVLCIDTDEAGRKAHEAIVKRLGHNWDILTVTLPDGHKDLNDCLMAGVTKDAIQTAVANAAEVKPDTIHLADWYCEAVWEDSRNRAGINGVRSGFSSLDAATHGFRGSEVTVWTGQSGHGKSTVLAMAVLNAGTAGVRTCITSLELKPAKLLGWLRLQAAGTGDVSRYQHDRIFRWFRGVAALTEHFGRVTLEGVLSDWAYCAKRYGCKQFILDPVQNISGKDEYDTQRDIITGALQFANTYDVHVHLVAHPKKTEGEGATLDQTTVKGNKAMTDLAHNIIVVSRTENATMIRLTKNREYGTLTGFAVAVDADCKQVFQAGDGLPDFWPWINAANDTTPTAVTEEGDDEWVF